MVRIIQLGYVLILSMGLMACDSTEPISIDYASELEQIALEGTTCSLV